MALASEAPKLLAQLFKNFIVRRSSTSPANESFVRAEQANILEKINLEEAFSKDSVRQKVNLCQNFYRNNEAKPHVFHAVRKAEIGIACDDFLSHEPMPPLGNEEFTKAASELILGAAAPPLAQNRVLGVQTRSSLDALCCGAQFLRQHMKIDSCYLANPSWQQYEHIFNGAGFKCHRYQYYNAKKAELNIYGLVTDLMSAPQGSVVVLDACAHNPTGMDPSLDEWRLIAHILKCKKMFPFFHMESQGLASGDLTQDAWPIRFFVDNDFDVFCAQSFVKNFGLYNETIGNLMVVLNRRVHLDKVKSQFETLLYKNSMTNSSIFASRIVAKILSTLMLRKDWEYTLKEMHKRLSTMRTTLVKKLIALKTPGPWEKHAQQRGFYFYTNLNVGQIGKLRDRHVYVPRSGRLSLTALNAKNVDFVAEALNEVIQSKNTTIDDHIKELQYYFNLSEKKKIIT